MVNSAETALGIPEDRICKTIANPRTRKPVAPMTLARAFATELETGATEFHTFHQLLNRYLDEFRL
jgi:hypothetical protein